MPALGNSDISIPPGNVRFVRSVVRAAVKEYFTENLSWSYQSKSDPEQAIVFVEMNEPRLRVCKRS